MTAVAADFAAPSLNWRRIRLPAAIVALGAVAVIGLAALGTSGSTRKLDPSNVNPFGAHALAALLRARGVRVDVTSDLTAGPSSTAVLLANPTHESSSALSTVATSAATVVVIDPGNRELAALDVPAKYDDADIIGSTLQPDCGFGPAGTAGSVHIMGDLYTVGPGATGCYRENGDAALVVATRPSGGHTIVLGSAVTLTNSQLDHDGNAALGLGLLDAPVVQWVYPPHGAPIAGPKRGLIALLPSRLEWAVLQLFVAVVLLALWRARRLGAPIIEPLPVVVRASETVEGRGRLLRAAGARADAARSLREASISRIAETLRLGAQPDGDALVSLAATATSREAAAIRSLLYGGAPADDAALTRLGRELADLEADTRRNVGTPTSALGAHA